MRMTTVSHHHGKQKSYPRLFVVVVCSGYYDYEITRSTDQLLPVFTSFVWENILRYLNFSI